MTTPIFCDQRQIWNSLRELKMPSNEDNEKNLYRFLRDIDSLETIKEIIPRNRLINWLTIKEGDLIPIGEYLCKKHLTETSRSIAYIYADILHQYQPESKKGLPELFDYYQLVYVIKEVFSKHVENNISLQTTGIKISISDLNFYAKRENSKIFIIYPTQNLLGKGTSGVVYEAYELVTRQLLALKYTQPKVLENEVSILQAMHINNASNKEGLQPLPLATFNVASAILTPKHEISLSHWMSQYQLPANRMYICKQIITAVKNKETHKIWHGNIKPSNILITPKGIEIIGWGDAVSYSEASSRFKTPKIRTFLYTCESDFLNTTNAVTEKNAINIIKYARIQEAFSIAITLFCTLSGGVFPFVIGKSELLKRKVPLVKDGITEEAKQALVKMGCLTNISMDIQRLLSYNPNERIASSPQNIKS